MISVSHNQGKRGYQLRGWEDSQWAWTVAWEEERGGKDGIRFQLKTCFKILKREKTKQTNQPKS